MKYRVHLYAEVRVPLEVEAESQEEAIGKVMYENDLYPLLKHGDVEFADEVHGALVDEDGDEEYECSQFWEEGKVWASYEEYYKRRKAEESSADNG
jgi:hypothetical protein